MKQDNKTGRTEIGSSNNLIKLFISKEWFRQEMLGEKMKVGAILFYMGCFPGYDYFKLAKYIFDRLIKQKTRQNRQSSQKQRYCKQ